MYRGKLVQTAQHNTGHKLRKKKMLTVQWPLFSQFVGVSSNHIDYISNTMKFSFYESFIQSIHVFTIFQIVGDFQLTVSTS